MRSDSAGGTPAASVPLRTLTCTHHNNALLGCTLHVPQLPPPMRSRHPIGSRATLAPVRHRVPRTRASRTTCARHRVGGGCPGAEPSEIGRVGGSATPQGCPPHQPAVPPATETYDRASARTRSRQQPEDGALGKTAAHGQLRRRRPPLCSARTLTTRLPQRASITPSRQRLGCGGAAPAERAGGRASQPEGLSTSSTAITPTARSAEPLGTPAGASSEGARGHSPR